MVLLQSFFSYVNAAFYQGSMSTFRILPNETDDNQSIKNLYNSCKCYSDSGTLISSDSVCVSTLVDYMLRAIAFTAESYTTASVASGKHKAMQFSWDELVDATNADLSKRSSGFQATHVTSSELHRDGGIAAHLNIRSSDSALVVDTNGTHATAQLRPSHLQSRSFLRTDFQYFEFEGVSGIRMQAQGLNGSATSAFTGDLTSFATLFAENDFVEHDSWSFMVCDKTRTRLLYGKLTSRERDFTGAYDNTQAIDCEPQS